MRLLVASIAWIVMLLASALALGGCDWPAGNRDQAVYSAVFKAAGERPPGRVLVAHDRTATIDEIFFGEAAEARTSVRRRFGKAGDALLDSFVENAKVEHPVARERLAEAVGPPLVFASQEELAALFRSDSDGWSRFRTKYSTDILLRVSPVAYDGKQALLYAGTSCGPLCGSGMIFLLEERGGEWIVIDSAQMWVS
ncbi:hypothetical protein BWI17_21400 [Betaproteobacteria bacterium GR16-43]|nr:hypothetical protein BWI17_21400 [Betaproteobacteria bacterium GR16-43]